jgi:hypothetical protein
MIGRARGARWVGPADDDPGTVDAEGVDGDRGTAQNHQGGVARGDRHGITEQNTLRLTHL